MSSRLSKEQKSEGREERDFKYPVLQCIGVSLWKRLAAFFSSQGAKSLQHLCPSCCLASDQQDLHLHSPPPPHASSFEMLTGTNLIFVSILFIKKSLAWYSWFAILVISIDVVVVGISDMKSVFLVPALRAVLRQCSDVVA